MKQGNPSKLLFKNALFARYKIEIIKIIFKHIWELIRKAIIS